MANDFVTTQHPWNIFKEVVSSHQTIKYPPMLSKFKPSDIDTTIPVSKKTTIQTALSLLGISDETLYSSNYNTRIKKHVTDKKFWDRPTEYLWNILELAKRRYELEMAHAHPDKGGDINRAIQLNNAWYIVKKIFKQHGFEL